VRFGGLSSPSPGLSETDPADKSHASCLIERVSFSKAVLRHSLGPAHYIFSAVFVVRVIGLARLTASPFLLPLRGDMHFYDDWAQRILHGQVTDHLAFYGLPLYAYFLALLYKVVGYGPFVPGLLQACVESATAVVIYKIGIHVFSPATQRVKATTDLEAIVSRSRGVIVGTFAALAWAFFVPAQAYSVILMPTVWMVFIFWLVVWSIVRKCSLPSARECLLLGLLIGFSAMGIATILFLLPLVIAALLFKREIDNHSRGRSFVLGAALLLTGVGVGTSPCWIHNYVVARDPVFLSAHSGINFWIGNNPTANGYPKFPPGLRAGQAAMLDDSISQAEKAAGHQLKRAEVSAYWSGKAKRYITTHFSDWFRLVVLKLRNFWSAFQYDDLSVITNLREDGVIFPGLYFGMVAALAVPGMLLAWRSVPGSRWITGSVLLQIAALLPVFTTERYRLAAVPGLLLCAAFGLSILWESCASKQFRTAAAYLALLVVSTTAVAWPQRDPSLWALDAYNSGWQAFETNNLPLAEKKLDLAYAYVPENAEINFALGNLRLAQDDKAAAKRFYFAALRLDPTHGGAYNNLGILALEESQWSLATKFFQDALKQDPRDAKTYYLLAQAHFRNGDLYQAKGEIAEALKINPNQPEFDELKRRIEEQSK
jgi:Tfp pilus assembly protein PilF